MPGRVLFPTQNRKKGVNIDLLVFLHILFRKCVCLVWSTLSFWVSLSLFEMPSLFSATYVVFNHSHCCAWSKRKWKKILWESVSPWQKLSPQIKVKKTSCKTALIHFNSKAGQFPFCMNFSCGVWVSVCVVCVWQHTYTHANTHNVWAVLFDNQFPFDDFGVCYFSPLLFDFRTCPNKSFDNFFLSSRSPMW